MELAQRPIIDECLVRNNAVFQELLTNNLLKYRIKQVSIKKKVLIITDGTDLIDSIAHFVKSAVTGAVKICRAEFFDGTDLLPAETFFIGCENSKPSSFGYLEEMLLHINFAGRHCGIFSTNKKALNYLSGILKNCEVTVEEPLLITEADAAVVNNWIKKINN